MFCSNCGHKNPAENHFCGMCGTVLSLRQAKASVEARDLGAVTQMDLLDEAPARPKSSAAQQAHPVSEKPQVRSSRVRVSGPSLLGLNEVDDQDSASEAYCYRYNDDMYKTNWGARIFFVLAVLVVVGGLVFLQWRSNRMLQAFQAANKAAGQASNSGGPEAQKEEQTGTVTGTESHDSQKTQEAQSSPTDSKTSTSGGPHSSVTEGQAATAGSGKPGDKASTNRGKNRTPSGPTGEAEASVDEQSKSAAAGDETTASQRVSDSEKNSEEPVRLAETYLQGRGVPRNCDEALGILRTASNRGNTRAQIKLGALYATGNCVAMDRVTAYHYFTRALQTQPSNVWLDQNRSVLWANMTDAERKQAMEVENVAR